MVGKTSLIRNKHKQNLRRNMCITGLSSSTFTTCTYCPTYTGIRTSLCNHLPQQIDLCIYLILSSCSLANVSSCTLFMRTSFNLQVLFMQSFDLTCTTSCFRVICLTSASSDAWTHPTHPLLVLQSVRTQGLFGTSLRHKMSHLHMQECISCVYNTWAECMNMV